MTRVPVVTLAVLSLSPGVEVGSVGPDAAAAGSDGRAPSSGGG